jgi:hypothetical protein
VKETTPSEEEEPDLDTAKTSLHNAATPPPRQRAAQPQLAAGKLRRRSLLSVTARDVDVKETTASGRLIWIPWLHGPCTPRWPCRPGLPRAPALFLLFFSTTGNFHLGRPISAYLAWPKNLPAQLNRLKI